MGNRLRFAIVGAAGYIAPRHMQAIQDTGHMLEAAADRSDSVGILDRYNKNAKFFQTAEDLARYAIDVKKTEEKIDYVSVCTPNYLHKAHCEMFMRAGCDIICEKPIALSMTDLESLRETEKDTGRKVHPILQLRLHPEIARVKTGLKPKGRHQVYISYMTPRGQWYDKSWKGQKSLSGGLEINIGIHLFDMILWIFGQPTKWQSYSTDNKSAAGTITTDEAEIKWILSINRTGENTNPERIMMVDGERIEFSSRFTDLHTAAYRQILATGTPTLSDAAEGLKSAIRFQKGQL